MMSRIRLPATVSRGDHMHRLTSRMSLPRLPHHSATGQSRTWGPIRGETVSTRVVSDHAMRGRADIGNLSSPQRHVSTSTSASAYNKPLSSTGRTLLSLSARRATPRSNQPRGNSFRRQTLCNRLMFGRSPFIRATAATTTTIARPLTDNAPSSHLSRSSSTTSSTDPLAMDRVRNIGIIAHVDAGKTTTVERMLFYSGYSRTLGNVDKGDTVMDCLQMERDRGITIQSAAITFRWQDHTFNLIDTPGHVDFTVEVERAVRVLDGAVAVFDAVAGVQAQTETVWRQADRYGVPRIAFLNKMDREGASVQHSLDSMQERLGVTPLLLQTAIGSSSSFRGMIDLVHMTTLSYSDKLGSNLVKTSLQTDGDHDVDDALITPAVLTEAREARQKLIEQVADIDERFMELVMSNPEWMEDPPTAELQGAIRRITLSMKAVPVFVGSSLRNRGVQPLLDAVVDYLPSPLEKPPIHAFDAEGNNILILPGSSKDRSGGDESVAELLAYPQWAKIDGGNDGPCVALAFKVVQDKYRGMVVYFRVYSGRVTAGKSIYNSTKKCKERIQKLVHIFADEMHEVPTIECGHIGAAIGLKATSTGDTLLLSDTPISLPSIPGSGKKDTADKAQANAKGKKKAKSNGGGSRGGGGGGGGGTDLQLKGVHVTPPMFVCALEPESRADEAPLLQALENLHLEDPSFRLQLDGNGDGDGGSGQLLVSGMGELHLDILLNRLKEHYNVNVNMGKVYIAYRSTVTSETEITHESSSTPSRLSGDEDSGSIRLGVHVLPRERGTGNLVNVFGVTDDDDTKMDSKMELEVEARCVDSGAFQGLRTQEKRQVRRSLRDGVQSALQTGALLGFPLEDTEVRIESVDWERGSGGGGGGGGGDDDDQSNSNLPSVSMLKMCAHDAIRRVTAGADVKILEPLMKVEVTAAEEYANTVLADLVNQRRGNVMSMDNQMRYRIIRCEVPLKEMMGYASRVRSLTKGSASFSMEFDRYGDVTSKEQVAVIKELRGF